MLYRLTDSYILAEIIARKGLNNVTVDSLVQDVTPKARGQTISLQYAL